jgi:hypothetical protein
LATFVATIEQQRSVPYTAQCDHRQDRRFGVALASGLSLIAVGIQGYHPYAEDGGLYLAGVERLLNPTLFPHGAAFVLEPTRYSLFAETVAAIVRNSHVGMAAILLVLHFLSIWVTLVGAWMLASRCRPERAARAGATMLLACWLSLPVAGTALVLMDPYLTARSISTPCMVLALLGMLDMTALGSVAAASTLRSRGALLWIASTATAALMHPLMAGYAFAATLVLACVRSENAGIRRWGPAGLAAAGLVVAGCIRDAARPETDDYRRIAITRSYWFPSLWSWYELVGLAAPLAILLAFAWQQRRARENQRHRGAARALCCMAIVLGATAWLVAMIFARSAASTDLVARLQPLRIFQIVYLTMVLMLGAMLGKLVLRGSLWRWAGAVVLLGGTMFAVNLRGSSDSPHLELPGVGSRNQWVAAFLWIRGNTPKDALFALDPDYINAPGEDAQCFRAIAERSALPDYSKDGGEASIAPELTAAWTSGQKAQQGLNLASTTDAMRLAALEPTGVSWVVLNADTSTELECPYANAKVKVCRLR